MFTFPFSKKHTSYSSLVLAISFLIPTFLLGQSDKKMTPEVYAEWNKLKQMKLSDSAETVIYTLEKEIGDKKLCIYNNEKGMTFRFDRVNTAYVDITGKYVAFTHGLAYDSLRTLKRKKVKKDKWPIDSLSIFNVDTKNISVISDVNSFSMPIKWSGYIVYNKKVEKITSDTINPTKSVCEESTIIIRQLATGAEDTIHSVKEYTIAEEAPFMLYSVCSGDSIKNYHVFKYDFNTKKSQCISTENVLVSQLCLFKDGSKSAFLGLEKKSDLPKMPWSLYFHQELDSVATKVAGPDSSFKPAEWIISSDGKLSFSDKGHRLMFGISPQALQQDTTKLEDEIVNVEIWHHDSPRLYTQMESSMEADKKKTFSSVYDIQTKSITQLETPQSDRSTISQKGDGRYALQISTLPYSKAVTWEGNILKDIYLYDLWNKNTTLIAQGQSDAPRFSPGSKYVYWYNQADSLWRYYDINLMKSGTLGDKALTMFYDEENDVPQLPGDYGIAGWLANDEAVLVYDKYDLWKINPADQMSNIALTDGRLKNTRYRYVSLDPEMEYIDPNTPMMLHVKNLVTKDEAYQSLDLKQGSLTSLLNGGFQLSSSVTSAKKGDHIIFTKQNFDVFPDLLMTNSRFEKIEKITDANPQQKEYGWGSCELFSWNDYNGKKIDGMLFFPPNFDRTKKYPLIVNFYERSSDDIHRHRAPEAHRSSINYTYYSNLGYVVFNPDIAYTRGQPGEDCYIAVNSGVDALIKIGYIDTTRMALQGHSWGGYQVAYLLTKTGRYRCAESGAPVVNMVSAYGGIRWESGMSRMFQYEKTQSRIGATLWENPNLYHMNSPIYQMEKVTTPVLIMHNDKDGAVPWYQGIEYYMALRRLGKPAWMLNYNDEPHWPVKWQNRLDFNIRMEQFFNHYLMGAPEPLWMKEGNTPLEKGIINKY